jgi:hypothetical protein
MSLPTPADRHAVTFHRFAASRRAAACLLAIGAIAPAVAQYAYDPSNPDEQGPGIRYFGSAKDEKGSLLAGVTVLIDSDETSFVFVTDEQGRFRGKVPLNMVAAKVTADCSKPGFQTVRVTKRPGPQAPKPTVQVDCVLRVAAAGAAP